MIDEPDTATPYLVVVDGAFTLRSPTLTSAMLRPPVAVADLTATPTLLTAAFASRVAVATPLLNVRFSTLESTAVASSL